MCEASKPTPARHVAKMTRCREILSHWRFSGKDGGGREGVGEGVREGEGWGQWARGGGGGWGGVEGMILCHNALGRVDKIRCEYWEFRNMMTDLRLTFSRA